MRRLVIIALVGLLPTAQANAQQPAPSPNAFFMDAHGNPVTAPSPRQVLPAVPVGAFFGAGILVPEAEVVPVGKLVEVVSPTVVARSWQPQIQPYDKVYMQVVGRVSAGDRIHLMRPDRSVAPYGRIYLATGSALVVAVESGIATVEVDVFYDRVQPGDIAVPMPQYVPNAVGAPRASTGLEGTLVALAVPQPVVSTEDMMFVNLGTASGVVEGDEYEAYLPRVAADWGTRPEIVVGRLQVIRAGRTTSAVRVIGLNEPALEVGLPVRLVAKMP
jgi:hypothetical protein